MFSMPVFTVIESIMNFSGNTMGILGPISENIPVYDGEIGIQIHSRSHFMMPMILVMLSTTDCYVLVMPDISSLLCISLSIAFVLPWWRQAMPHPHIQDGLTYFKWEMWEDFTE
jgi:hypothetical protein